MEGAAVTQEHNYVGFDELDRLPEPNRRNYEFELEYFAARLPKHASVLQVGSMDGARIIRFLERRPDLNFTGLEIEQSLVDLARENLRKAHRTARFVAADITEPPEGLGHFDYVLCLNNTLGFIPDYETAFRRMSAIGMTYVSVYAEAFDNQRAREYYDCTGIEIEDIDGDVLLLRHIGPVRRFRRATVESWGTIAAETPLGYVIAVNTSSS